MECQRQAHSLETGLSLFLLRAACVKSEEFPQETSNSDEAGDFTAEEKFQAWPA